MRPTSIALTGFPGTDLAPVAAVLSGSAEITTVVDIADLRRRLDGGAVALAVDPALVERGEGAAVLRERTTVVWVDVTVTGPRSGRPDGAAAGRTTDEREARRQLMGPLTVAAEAIVAVGDRELDDPAAVAAAVERHLTERAGAPDRLIERVELGGARGYPIVVGRGVRHEVGLHLPERAKRVAIVTQDEIGIEIDTGRHQEVFVVEDGEGAKRLDEVGRLASAFARWGMTRADCVVSIGGGVVSDLAGFVAASYHRGIPVVHVPTTLLGQIDAAIGGKCGVNLAEGKNLVGAFWQPEAVLCDVDTLATLPARQFRAGMGELAKYHFLGGGQLDRVELVERVARSVAIKADVVSGDEREGGRRAILNYGHTLAHALETLGGYGGILHGEAVAVGLIYAAELAALLGRIDRDRVAEHRRVVAAYGLDGGLPPGSDPEQIIDLFSRDKKAIDGITFVLDGPDGVETVAVDDRALLGEALAAMEPAR